MPQVSRGGPFRWHSTTEEAGPEAAVIEGFQFGFEADAVFDEVGLLLDQFEALLDQALPFGLQPGLLLFERRDGLLLQLALELDEVEAFDLSPEAIYLHAGSVALLADLLHLPTAFLEAALVVLALLQEPLVALERDCRQPRGAGSRLPADDLTLEDLPSCGLCELAGEIHDLGEAKAVTA